MSPAIAVCSVSAVLPSLYLSDGIDGKDGYDSRRLGESVAKGLESPTEVQISWRFLMGEHTYHIVLKEDEAGWYAVQCVELPGAISQGRTKEEALANIKEAIKLLLDHLASKVAGQRVEEVVVAT